jgi:hypothetical protein
MLLTEKVQEFIEANWDNDDEWITPAQQEYLEDMGEDAMALYRECYFADLVERYQGTCQSITGKDETFLEEFNLFDDLDNIQFECQQCGWWYESGDEGESENGDLICKDCEEENKL